MIESLPPILEVPQQNPAEQLKIGVGLTFVGLAAVTPISVLSASNSSKFSYRSFIKDEASEKAAREALNTFIVQSVITTGVLSIMAWAATKEWKWAGIAAGAGMVSTALLYWDMSSVVDEVAEGFNGKAANVLLEG